MSWRNLQNGLVLVSCMTDLRRRANGDLLRSAGGCASFVFHTIRGASHCRGSSHCRRHAQARVDHSRGDQRPDDRPLERDVSYLPSTAVISPQAIGSVNCAGSPGSDATVDGSGVSGATP